jgi:hypothetical protein
MKLASTVKFADENVRELYLKSEIFTQLTSAFVKLGANAFSGIQIPKRLMPKKYLKRGVPNLWKFNLANGWRLLYFIVEIDSSVCSVIPEWLSHKDYKRTFKY